MSLKRCLGVTLIGVCLCRSLFGVDVPVRGSVEGQPLGANVERVLKALEFLGTPLDEARAARLRVAIQDRNAAAIQELLDPKVLAVVSINPELRVKVSRGPAEARLQQGGWRPVLVKVLNDGAVSRPLRADSPQSGAVYAGGAIGSLQRQQQTELNAKENTAGSADRFLDLEMFTAPPMTDKLSGLEVEYAVLLLSSSEAGRREATLAFDIGQGTQDLGFRAELPILFDVRPAVPVKLSIHDFDGSPTAARFVFRDEAGHVYPLQAKRLAPDFFFQPQIYRHDGGTVLLPPGRLQMEVCRGPEYVVERREVVIADPARQPEQQIEVTLRRWVDPAAHGFYVGDHHIHGAGCSHYQSPTLGVTPQDMYLQVKGEGLNVGCVLTWGPCFEFQRNYFSPAADLVSEPFTVLKYDLEISGFGSAALGHVCLLNLKDQTYPGSNGTKTEGWPTWTVPVLRWCKEQGGVTGFPHSAMRVDPPAAMQRLLSQNDTDNDKALAADEAASALLPEPFAAIDADRDGRLSEAELIAAGERAADRLPNLVVPEMNGGGAMEICVAVSEGVCDFISAMDTPRIGEWNTWYHLLNCGFPLKVSGETDFPCMSSRRVGQGRVYVQLGNVDRIDFTEWCRGIAAGRSYVSDGFAHALKFKVNDVSAGDGDVALAQPGTVEVRATVAFAEEHPIGVAYGTEDPPQGPRMVGETRELLRPRRDGTMRVDDRLVEIVVNGRVVGSQRVPADAQEHELSFRVPIERSSWVALRHFPQLHTNPVNVLVAGQPIRASRESAEWCAETVRQLWERKHRSIAEGERPAAREAYDRAIRRFERISAESTVLQD